jgi:beta-lactamase regulating signal transducer with metallopeptidase domain
MLGAILTATLQAGGVLEPVSGAIPVAVRGNDTAAISPVERTGTGTDTDIGADADPNGVAVTPFDAAGQDATARDWGNVLVLAWAAGALLLGAGTLRSALAAHRALRDRQPVREGVLLDRARALASAARLRNEPRISTSSWIGGPMTLPSGEICVPDWVPSSLPSAQIDAMLAHEMAHWLRRDARWQVAGLAVHAFLFFQPLNALARRRLNSLAELAADDWAAMHTGQGHALAECLATFARACPQRAAPVFVAAMVQRPGALVLRVQRLLAGRHQNGILTRRQQVALALAATLVATALPGVMAQSRVTAAQSDLVSRAELDWIATASQRRGTSATFHSRHGPEEALAAVTTALEQGGWSTQPPPGFSEVFYPPPEWRVFACLDDVSLRVTTRETGGGSDVTYSINSMPSAPPCESDDVEIANYLPDLRIPGTATNGVRNIVLGVAGPRSQELSTMLNPNAPIDEIEHQMSAQLVEQGWVAEVAPGSTTAGTRWSRRVLDLDLEGTLSVAELDGDAGVRVSFRIAQASEGAR